MGAGTQAVAQRRQAILLLGPTGSGKSDLAMHLAEALPLEIVSVDSALVYRGMDIGTAKPNATARARIPHHLMDIRDQPRATPPASSHATRCASWRTSGSGGGNRCSWAGPCFISMP